MVCAKMIYMQDGNSWKNFQAAKACGCYTGDESELTK